MKPATQMQKAEPDAPASPVPGTPVVRSEIIRKLFAMITRVAQHDASVLIVGETGSGKEVIVKEIHRLSPRADKALVEVNCAALPEHLMESELFGYEKGAFSGADVAKPGLFELADGGTILLDEIGEMDIKFQAKLLRVLDGASYYRLGGSRKMAVNVRVIAATNRDLEGEIRQGKFRKDLYYRLAQFQLQVPPLRERSEDVVALAEYFLQQQLPGTTLSREAIEVLQRYDWPGNVRELKNVIFKTAMQAKPGTREIRGCDLPASLFTNLPPCKTAESDSNLADTEKRMILDALARAGGNQEEAARMLGISTRTVRRKLSRYKNEAGTTAQALGALSSYQKRYFRVNVELPIILRSETSESEASMVNISAGGVAIRSSRTFEHGTKLGVSFLLPGTSTTFEAQARMAWSGPDNLAGLQFVDIHPALEAELYRWLYEKARAEGWIDPVGSSSL